MKRLLQFTLMVVWILIAISIDLSWGSPIYSIDDDRSNSEGDAINIEEMISVEDDEDDLTLVNQPFENAWDHIHGIKPSALTPDFLTDDHADDAYLLLLKSLTTPEGADVLNIGPESSLLKQSPNDRK